MPEGTSQLRTIVGIPLHGSVEHIVKVTSLPGVRHHGTTLCGVRGSNGWWRTGFRAVEKPLEEAECKKCLKLHAKETSK